ncbi:MAG: aminotransferase class IV [Synechococcus sp. SB0662_bin_45]|nr:aminotransferase class IV [Synechococcus sp. SB0668_bin_13]MYE21306.1 aminotransferase class IV [Synechococcus sp. SB0662_bin_45]MYG64067.1 aminotransferase class IV [Synechococcus sp. SB0675_bin_7]MYI71374.1 aminotransferase class IV [Synechococcus sp. SB0673_bin_10]MYK85812.1 aminotransferase class IV [Synechococcus sp. SB0669_bin_7]
MSLAGPRRLWHCLRFGPSRRGPGNAPQNGPPAPVAAARAVSGSPAESLAWLAGRWDQPQRLAVPLDDRGLNLADGVFETLLWRSDGPVLWPQHWQRLQRGCALLGLAPEPDVARIQALAAEGFRCLGSSSGQAALRITVSRGSGERGLALPQPQQPRLWLQLHAVTPCFAPVDVITSRLVRRHGDCASSRCKTLNYTDAVIARREAGMAAADDALLLSSTGQYSCATAANLWVQREMNWLTPGLDQGCLPGIMRGQLLQHPTSHEAPVSRQTLLDGGGLLLNSISCRPIRSLDGHAPRRQLSPQEAGRLFAQLCSSDY